MYELDVIKTTRLAKKLGGPPIFHDGFLEAFYVDKKSMRLEIRILSQNNPVLTKDTKVSLTLHGIHYFEIISEEHDHALMVIHDLEIRKEGELLRLLLESNEGKISTVVFDTIELTEAEKNSD